MLIVHFGQSTYFKANHGVDRYLLENYLLPGLAKQAGIAGGSRGIELPVGANQPAEYLPLEEAKSLVLDFLAETHNLLETDKTKLSGIKSYERFANLASELYQAKVEDPNKLLTAARLQNVADLRAAQIAHATTATAKFDPGKAIDDYNRLYLKLLSYSRVGIPHQLLQQLVPVGIPLGSGNLTQAALASVIAANLPRLHAAGSVGSSPAAQDFAVARELGKIIKTSYPEMSGYLNFLGDKQTASTLHDYTSRLTTTLESTHTSLADYEQAQVAAATSIDHYLLNEAELRTQVYNALPLISDAERTRLTDTLMRELVISSARPLTANEILAQVSTKLQVPPIELAAIQKYLADAGLSTSLEYRQNELALMVGTHYLTRGEHELLKRGINPFLAVKFGESKVKTKEQLQLATTTLLSSYNTTHQSQFKTLEEAYQAEINSPAPSMEFIGRARSLHNHLSFYDHLSPVEERLIRRTRFGRSVADLRSRVYETQAKFFDKWIDLEETVTGQKLIHKWMDRWDSFAEGFMLPGTKVPIFRLIPWAYEQIDAWKKVTTLGILSRTASSKSWIGKSIHWTFTQYQLGDFTVSGATYHAWHSAWSGSLKWAMAKTGMTGVVKYASTSASRTGLRLLIKLGGKALARAGEKTVLGLVAAASAVGSVLSVVLAVGAVFDLIGLAWNFVKEFVHNIEFRKTVIKWTAAIGAFFAAINFTSIFGTFGLIVGAVFAWTLQTLLFSLLIFGILAASTTFIYRSFGDSVRLDSSLAQLAANILCEDAGSTTTPPTEPASTTVSAPSNQVTMCANCLVKYLAQCYGQSVTGTKIQSKGLSCIIASVISPASAAAIEASAIGYNYLQCVGFARAAAICAGGDLPGQAVAADYIRNLTPGYRFVSGASSCQPGDFGIIDGAVGHIFVWGGANGSLATGIDANKVCSGCVSSNTPIPLSSVAGCLKRN